MFAVRRPCDVAQRKLAFHGDRLERARAAAYGGHRKLSIDDVGDLSSIGRECNLIDLFRVRHGIEHGCGARGRRIPILCRTAVRSGVRLRTRRAARQNECETWSVISWQTSIPEIRRTARQGCDRAASSMRAFHTHAATGFALRYFSISRISSELKRNSAARTICFACSAERIPTIAPVTTGSRSVQAIAISPGVRL